PFPHCGASFPVLSMSFRPVTDESLTPLPAFSLLVPASLCDRDLSLQFAATALTPALSGRPRGFLACSFAQVNSHRRESYRFAGRSIQRTAASPEWSQTSRPS